MFFMAVKTKIVIIYYRCCYILNKKSTIIISYYLRILSTTNFCQSIEFKMVINYDLMNHSVF